MSDTFPLNEVAIRRYSFGHQGICAGSFPTDAIGSRPSGDVKPVYFWRLEQNWFRLDDQSIDDDTRKMLTERIESTIEGGSAKNFFSYTTMIWGGRRRRAALFEYRFNFKLVFSG